MRPNLNNLSGEKEALSLLELNTRIRGALSRAFPETCWVRAEMSDVRVNTSSGHCYLEFVEKNAQTGQLVAKVRGSIWAKTFRMLKPYFEMETGQMFASGLKVLVKVSVEFHELYGLSLTVLDIDPAYTLGDMVRKRMEIIRQLQEEGVFTLNKELPFPLLPRRIAIITSPTAAGYEDFMNQLTRNKGGYPFYTKLFPALMQGERTEASVIAALDRIYQHQDLFDVVVIIRGGGATSDLNSFDSYLLAANCAQFPLPIITGIGHERDDTVVDLVAHTRMKTPTAVAEFLISRMDSVVSDLQVERSLKGFWDRVDRRKNRRRLYWISTACAACISVILVVSSLLLIGRDYVDNKEEVLALLDSIQSTSNEILIISGGLRTTIPNNEVINQKQQLLQPSYSAIKEMHFQ